MIKLNVLLDCCGNLEYTNNRISYWDYVDNKSRKIKIKEMVIMTYDKEKFISEI